MKKNEKYVWYIECIDTIYFPNEDSFQTKEDALKDGISSGYSEKFIGIYKVNIDNGYITIIETCKKPDEIFYIEK